MCIYPQSYTINSNTVRTDTCSTKFIIINIHIHQQQIAICKVLDAHAHLSRRQAGTRAHKRHRNLRRQRDERQNCRDRVGGVRRELLRGLIHSTVPETNCPIHSADATRRDYRLPHRVSVDGVNRVIMIELATTQDCRRRKIWKLNMFRKLKTILSSLDTSSRLFKIPANSFVALASAVRITGVKVTVKNFRHQKKKTSE